MFERLTLGYQRVEKEGDEIVALAYEANPTDRYDAQFHHASTTWASRNASSGSAMIVVVTSTLTPRALMTSRKCASA